MASSIPASLLVLRIGETDCEALGSGFLAQPVNALTSLAYFVVGVVIMVAARGSDRWRARSTVFGLCLVGIGFGSVLFHGPQPAGSRFLHDVPIVLAVLLMALHDLSIVFPRFRRLRETYCGVALVVMAAALVVPDAASVATAVLAVVVIVAEVVIYRRRLRPAARGRQRALLGALAGVAAVAGASYLLGRTGAPSCDPDSAIQFHGLWHLVSATVFALWWWLALADRSPSRSPETATDTLPR